uniref:CPN60II n=1 Tax=Arundo donax TaxID=35708 RepID=A0A0A9GZ00_ARUDO
MPLSRRSSPTIVRSAAAPAPHRAHASAPQETCRGDPDGGVVNEEAAAEYVSSVGAAAGLPARLHAARAKLGGDPVFFLLTAAAVTVRCRTPPQESSALSKLLVLVKTGKQIYSTLLSLLGLKS